jgi:hypothetical protein
MFAAEGSRSARIFSMLQEDGLRVRMLLENADQLRAAVPAMSDDADSLFHE